MFALEEKMGSHPWWFDNHKTQRRSKWLQSTLSELDEKTMAMLKLIEADADSFSQRAEMYYKKRPELISMVENFYRAHRSLAERFEMLKSESRTRLIPQLSSPLSTKYQSNKSVVPMEKAYDSYSETYSESGESEIDDPEQGEEVQIARAMVGEEGSEESGVDNPNQEEKTGMVRTVIEEEEESVLSIVDDTEEKDNLVGRIAEGVVNMVSGSEVMKLRDEIERLKEENKIQKEQLRQKDEDKREVIRQLSLSLEILKENVSVYKRSTVKESSKKWGPFEFNKVKGLFSVKLFTASSKSPA